MDYLISWTQQMKVYNMNLAACMAYLNIFDWGSAVTVVQLIKKITSITFHASIKVPMK